MSVEFEGRKKIHLDDDEENIEAIIRLPRRLFEEIKAEARRRGISTASFVREVLMEALKVPAEIDEEID
jgi:predicted DNA binding CopG/RHH family protein